jgi:hypothetical protein
MPRKKVEEKSDIEKSQEEEHNIRERQKADELPVKYWRNPKWSYEDISYWTESCFAFLMMGWFDDGQKKRRYRLLFYKAVNSETCFIAAEYMNEKRQKCIETFGTAVWDYLDVTRTKRISNPSTQKILMEEFVYHHLDKGNIFKSHSTPLVKIDPMNKITSLFCESFISNKVEDVRFQDNIKRLSPEAFMQKTTINKIKNLLKNRNKKEDKVDGRTLQGQLEKVEREKHKLTPNDIADAELAIDRCQIFVDHIRELMDVTDCDLKIAESKANLRIVKVKGLS